MNDLPAGSLSDFKPRKGAIITSGILFGLFGLMLCGLGALMVLQYFLISKIGGLDPKAAEEMESMQGMMGIASVVNLIVYGGTGVLMIVLAFGLFTMKRWSRPFALTLSWGWLYMGVIMMASLILMMGPMKQFMGDAMNAQIASVPAGSAPLPSMDSFFTIFMVIYLIVIFLFLVLMPALLLWLNWGSDVRRTLELHDPKPRWTDRQPVPLIGLTITAAAFALFSLPGMVMLNQPWMSQFLPGGALRYLYFLIPFVWFYVAWGSYRGQIAAWVVALVLLIGSATMGILTMQHVDWAVMYQQMGMPEAEVARMASMVTEMFAPKKMGILMSASMLPLLAYLLWALRFFRRTRTA